MLAAGAPGASAQELPAVFRAWWTASLFEGDSVARPIRLGLTRLPPIVPLDHVLPAVEPHLFTRLVSYRLPESNAVSNVWRGSIAERIRGPLVSALADTALFLPPPVVRRDTAVAEQELLGGTIGRYADLRMRIAGNGELGGQWLRYEPCDPSVQFNCNPGLFPQLKPDVQFAINVGGTISDRVHVDVDYDQTREETFASNDIRVFYEGFPDEVLQRIEVGDVAFAIPRSRYLTQGVPAGNFGFMASGQLGPMDFQTVWAQQRGDLSTREFRLAGGATQGLVQADRIVLDDADYTKGQFFFLVHPSLLSGAPHVDALALIAADAPPTLRPEPGGTIQLYRDERIPPASGQQQVDLFLADAVSADGMLRHSGLFRRLDPEQDYLVHSSGLWIMLRSPLRLEEALAVAYVTESGDTVGTMNAEQSPAGVTPTLRLLRSPAASHQPGRPTWDFEMHQVYRVNSTSGVDVSSLDVDISLGDLSGGITFRESNGQQVNFLRLFGLDEDAPADRLDVAQVFQPEALSGFGGGTSGSRITGTFIVFPTLEPFRTPPPAPSAGLDAAGTLALLGTDANRTIYESTDPVLRDGGGRFRLNVGYRVRVEGLQSSFNLGQFGIREGSERITIGDRTLTRDVDYTIDYEIGQVTLSDPAGIFGPNPNAEIRATWEQKALFQVAPTSMFGANARWQLGRRGELNVVGLVQTQKTLYSRPQLGTEPAGIFMGGINADVDLGGAWLDRTLAGLPFLRSAGGSQVTLTGEMALSLPDPNRRDQAYYEDFEGADEVGLDVRRQQWKLGSRPESVAGDDGVLPASLDATTAARLVWQHDIAAGGLITGSLVPSRDIDRQINIIGNQLPEPVMWLTFGDRDNVPGERLWRSMTTVLSTTGRDMTRSEFLELYVSSGGPEPLALIFDFGTVAEDAFYVDPDGATGGVYESDGRPWGLGRLDEEARIAEREVWGLDKDARGLWDQPCLAEGIQAYGLGDERSNCTKGNGVPDTEDLDGNGVLDQSDGAYFRYVIPLNAMAHPWLVRDTSATGTGFRLYRIPLRDGAPVNGASDGTWRFIKHVRMTVAGEPGGIRKNLSIARMRIIGSRWTKRDVHGINRGLISDEPGIGAASTQLRVGPVSRVTDGSAYTPPPGVTDQLQDPSAQFGAQGIEVNEKAQRIAYDALEPGDRAEIYFRYPQQPRSFLNYRQLRLWALAKQGEWGTTGAERLVIKIGTDDRNFYLYQTRLAPAVGTGPATPNDWLPEIVIDFDRWFELRVEAEERLIDDARAGALQDTVWSADSAYAIVLEDRARAPNLSAVREVSIAVYNGGPIPMNGEVWINDIRLDEAFRDPGAAGNLRLDISGGDVFTASIGYANQGAVFRQLNQSTSYVGAGDVSLSGTARLDRMVPAGWGIDAPLSVTHTRSARDPSFLDGSDVRATELPGLRDTGAGLTSIGLRIAKRTPAANAWAGLLVDGMTLTFGYDAAHTNTITSRAETGGVRAGVDWQKDVGRVDFDAIPGFLESALRALAPPSLEESAAFARLVNARLRLTPERVGFGTNWASSDNRAYRYQTILAGPRDSLIAPIESPRRYLENTMSMGLRPFDPLTAGVTLRSSRDLLDPDRAAADPLQREALENARGGIAGADLGWETNRSMTTTFSFRPVLASWLRPTLNWNTRYGTDRNPSYLSLDVFEDDTTATLQRRFGSDRQIQRRLDFQPPGFVSAAFGENPDSMGVIARALATLIQPVQSVNVTWNSTLGSQFEREDFAPGLGYQLGLGDLASFRAIGSDTAATASDRDDVRIGSLIALPRGAQLNVNYTRTASQGFDARGGKRTQQQTGWPNLRLAWRQIPLPASIQSVLLSVNAGLGFERVDRESVLGSRTPQIRGADERRWSPELSVTITGGITASYNGTISRAETMDPTGNGEQDGDSHRIQVAGIFQPPGFLREKMRNPISTILSFTDDAQRRCRFRPSAEATETCVHFVDTTNRTFGLTLDTVLSDITIGLRVNYTSRDNRAGTRTGSNQFQVALFGGFVFESGEFGGR
ncbi:MAG: cell surface protein SprA [Gemmatimonadetes bacterium]|nr:cell surface protein SprA [Gemmatimonadota bacterium]